MQNLARSPQIIACLTGPLLLWAIRCISELRKEISLNASDQYNSQTRNEAREALRMQAHDLMVFAGLVKLRLGQGVLERIMGGCLEVGVY